MIIPIVILVAATTTAAVPFQPSSTINYIKSYDSYTLPPASIPLMVRLPRQQTLGAPLYSSIPLSYLDQRPSQTFVQHNPYLVRENQEHPQTLNTNQQNSYLDQVHPQTFKNQQNFYLEKVQPQTFNTNQQGFYQIPVPTLDISVPTESSWNIRNDPKLYYGLTDAKQSLTKNFPKKFNGDIQVNLINDPTQIYGTPAAVIDATVESSGNTFPKKLSKAETQLEVIKSLNNGPKLYHGAEVSGNGNNVIPLRPTKGGGLLSHRHEDNSNRKIKKENQYKSGKSDGQKKKPVLSKQKSQKQTKSKKSIKPKANKVNLPENVKKNLKKKIVIETALSKPIKTRIGSNTKPDLASLGTVQKQDTSLEHIYPTESTRHFGTSIEENVPKTAATGTKSSYTGSEPEDEHDHAEISESDNEQESESENVEPKPKNTDGYSHGLSNSLKSSLGIPVKSGAQGERLVYHMAGHDGPMSYKWGFDTGKGHNRQYRFEERDKFGIVKGQYGYYDKNGKLNRVNYNAHPEAGFHAEPVESKE